MIRTSSVALPQKSIQVVRICDVVDKKLKTKPNVYKECVNRYLNIDVFYYLFNLTTSNVYLLLTRELKHYEIRTSVNEGYIYCRLVCFG